MQFTRLLGLRSQWALCNFVFSVSSVESQRRWIEYWRDKEEENAFAAASTFQQLRLWQTGAEQHKHMCTHKYRCTHNCNTYLHNYNTNARQTNVHRKIQMHTQHKQLFTQIQHKCSTNTCAYTITDAHTGATQTHIHTTTTQLQDKHMCSHTYRCTHNWNTNTNTNAHTNTAKIHTHTNSSQTYIHKHTNTGHINLSCRNTSQMHGKSSILKMESMIQPGRWGRHYHQVQELLDATMLRWMLSSAPHSYAILMIIDHHHSDHWDDNEEEEEDFCNLGTRGAITWQK